MIVSTKIHQRVLDELATMRGQNQELTRRCDAQQILIDFLCAQINQLGKERAILMRQVTRLDVPVPEIARAPTTTEEMRQLRAALTRPDVFGNQGTDEVIE